MLESWNRFLKDMEKSAVAQDTHIWLSTVQAQRDGDTLILNVPNHYTKDWINAHCLNHIEAFYKNKNGDAGGGAWPKAIQLTVGDDARAAAPAEAKSRRSMSREESYINTRYTFDGLVSGRTNERAIVAAKALAKGELDCAPLYIYGGVGLGKTHIMHAIGNELLRQNSDLRVAYRHAEKFVSEMVTAIREKRIDEFKSFYRSLDVLLIDDVQMFINKDQTQEQFFHTFNVLIEAKKRMVLSSDRYPRDISGIQERIRSRLSGGLCEMIEPPEFETRVAILEKKAVALELDLPRDAASFIANIVQSNVRELEGVLNRIRASAIFSGSAITTEFVKNTLSDIVASRKNYISLDNIKRSVAKFYNITARDLCSARRTENIVRPRQIAMAIAKEVTSHSYPEIGEAFGGKDHTTVIHACRKIKALRASKPDFDVEYRQIKGSLHCL